MSTLIVTYEKDDGTHYVQRYPLDFSIMRDAYIANKSINFDGDFATIPLPVAEHYNHGVKVSTVLTISVPEYTSKVMSATLINGEIR